MQKKFQDPLLLAMAVGILFVPVVLLRDLSGMEFRMALIVRNIIEEGPSLIPRLYGSPYHDYPPLYFLIASLPARAAGSVTPFSLALPAFLAAMGTVFISSLFASRISRRTGWMTGLALLSTPLFFFYSIHASVDLLLTFFIAMTVIAYYLYISSGSCKMLLLAGVGLWCGILTKGPVGAVIPIAVILLYCAVSRMWAGLVRAACELGLFTVLCAAALALGVMLAEGRGALGELIDAQLIDRIVEVANKPRIYYAGVFFGGFAPWSLFAFLGLFRRAGGEGGERRAIITLSKVWLVATFFIFTMARIKHTRYILPLAPPVAFLCAWFWGSYLREKSGALRPLLTALRFLCVVILAAGAAGVLIAGFFLPHSSRALAVILPALGALAAVIAARTARGDTDGLFCVCAATIVFGFLAFCQFEIPRINAREDARLFVSAAENEAQGCPVIFFCINRDKQGLRYDYWSGRGGALHFTDTIDELEFILPIYSPALVIAPARWDGVLRTVCGGRLEFALDGCLGKRRCAVFCARAAAP